MTHDERSATGTGGPVPMTPKGAGPGPLSRRHLVGGLTAVGAAALGLPGAAPA
nr:hypothetical protein [Chloroflexia bacterium]